MKLEGQAGNSGFGHPPGISRRSPFIALLVAPAFPEKGFFDRAWEPPEGSGRPASLLSSTGTSHLRKRLSLVLVVGKGSCEQASPEVRLGVGSGDWRQRGATQALRRVRGKPSRTCVC